MDTEGTLGGIALVSEIVIGGEFGAAQKGERRAIGGEEAVIGVWVSGFERMIEAIEDITKCRSIQFGSFLNQSGRRGMILVVRESLDQFVASTTGALSNQKLHVYICRQFPVSREVAGIGNVVLDVV